MKKKEELINDEDQPVESNVDDTLQEEETSNEILEEDLQEETITRNTIIDYHKVDLDRDGNIILSDINISVAEGDFVYLIGKVGSGKSTFLKSLYSEIPLREGEGRVLDYQLDAIKRKQIPTFLRR